MAKLPKQVLETVSYLRQAKDPRFPTMQALVAPREIKEDWDEARSYPDEKSYESMWKSIKRHEEKIRGQLLTNEWVLDFLDDVIEAQKLPQYMYLKNERRLDLMVEIDALTKKLADLYVQNDSSIGARLKKALSEKDLNLEKKNPFNALKTDQISGADMAQLLSSYTQSLITDIGSIESLTKDSKGVEERMFAVALVKRNLFLYETPLNEVVAIAMWAIHGRNNSPTTISNLVKRSQEF